MNASGRPTAPVVLEPEEREYLERQVRRRRVSRSISERCRIILRSADGIQSKVVAAELGVHEHTVGKWRRRFLKDRMEGLLDEARPGRPRTIADDQVAAVIERTLRSKPDDATHWSIRSMAGETGFSHTTIRRIWTAFGLQPHRSETFKLSSDPLFVNKVRDIVGLYLSPPNRAFVLSVDEKSQIQALDREQPVLPMMPGMPERRTHSYVRHGTTSLFAALDIASGFVIGKCYKRPAPQSFLTSSSRSTRRYRATSMSTSSWTITPPTRLRWSGHGSPAARTTMSISRQPRHPGSTRLNAGLPSLPASSCAAAFIPPRANWSRTSEPSSNATIRTQSRTDGQSRQTRYSPRSSASARPQNAHYAANFRFR